ncbi:hypothetical protein DU52_07820 [Methanosarcina mazei]|uniref:Invasion protein n=1 Tax=Methanosarcina mazei TaxID=2209 RepID=A0A0F8GD72_METMZ|nr:hypothetical protein DU52_07820 [Methanosarcina mazei]
MTWELILDGYSESSYSATPRFAAARLPWFVKLATLKQRTEKAARTAGRAQASTQAHRLVPLSDHILVFYIFNILPFQTIVG